MGLFYCERGVAVVGFVKCDKGQGKADVGFSLELEKDAGIGLPIVV